MPFCERKLPQSQFAARFILAIGLTWTAGLVPVEACRAQAYAELSGPGQPRPIAPLLDPRPAEGKVPEARWKTTRDAADGEPTATFLKSVQGTDVVLEVILGQGRLLTTKKPIADERGVAVIAVGDPSILDFEVLPNPRMIRLIGKRPGVTDLSITTADEQSHIFEVHVGYDLALMGAQLRRVFPDAEIKLTQLRGHLILEGQARSLAQIAAIEGAIKAYLQSPGGASFSAAGGMASTLSLPQPVGVPRDPATADQTPLRAGPQADVELGSRGGGGAGGSAAAPQIINLMQVPGVHQVMLQVCVGELNRTSLREMGADWFFHWQNNAIGTHVASATQTLNGFAGLGSNSTAFGIFGSGDVALVMRALRENAILTVLAEPNLMALSGQRASFLAGGQFPVPVPQGAGGVNNQVTVQFKDFGVSLDFTPYVLDDKTIRLQVSPEVSSIDEALGTTLVAGGDPVPGLSTRRVETTVELTQGTTLALAGLLQMEVEARSSRLPGIGDLPYLGPLFSKNGQRKAEKELLVLVTPHLVHPMTPDQVPPLPGSEIVPPSDKEFYCLNRLEAVPCIPQQVTLNNSHGSFPLKSEGREIPAPTVPALTAVPTAPAHPAVPTAAGGSVHLMERMKLEQRYLMCPVGLSE